MRPEPLILLGLRILQSKKEAVKVMIVKK